MKLYLNLCCIFIGLTSTIKGSDGHGCGEWIDVTPPPSNSVNVESLSPFATAKLEELKLAGTDTLQSVTIDTDELEKFVRNVAKGKGWTAERIARAVSDTLKEAADLLEKQIRERVP